MVRPGFGLITSSNFWVPQVNQPGSMASFVPPAAIPLQVAVKQAVAQRGAGMGRGFGNGSDSSIDLGTPPVGVVGATPPSMPNISFVGSTMPPVNYYSVAGSPSSWMPWVIGGIAALVLIVELSKGARK